MLRKWIAKLFGRNGHGDAAVQACVPSEEAPTKKNVDRHSQKLIIDLKQINKELAEAVPED